MKNLTLLIVGLVVMTICLAASAEQTIEINEPGQSSGFVYAVEKPMINPYEALDRAAFFAQSFEVTEAAGDAAEYHSNDGMHVVRMVDGEKHWSYMHREQSGFELFVDNVRWLKADPESATPMIGEEDAKQIALGFAEYYFQDSKGADIRDVEVTRVWNGEQLNPDTDERDERVIREYSNEAVVKIRREINGLPVFGRGNIRIHVNNDGTVVAAFRRYRDFLETPMDVVDLPTYEELEAIAKEKAEYYCPKEEDSCRVRVDVGYFEGGEKNEQQFLEPMIYVRIKRETKGGDAMVDRFTIPLRDPEVAENLIPE